MSPDWFMRSTSVTTWKTCVFFFFLA